MLAPVEFTRVYNHASNGCAVSANPLSCRVNYNICSMLDRLNEISTSSESIIDLKESQPCSSRLFGRTHNDGNTMFMGNFCNGLKIRNIILRVSNALDVNFRRVSMRFV
jgi:hypothetical protein